MPIVENEIENEVEHFQCENCNDYYEIHTNIHASENVCDYCFESEYASCEFENCENIFHSNNAYSVTISSQNTRILLCRSCFCAHHYECNFCGDNYLTNENHNTENCREMAFERRQLEMMARYENELIKPYHYKPKPQFKTTNRKQNSENYLFNNQKTFFGFELEVVTENANTIKPVAEMVQNSLKKNAYLKQDGSLEEMGFEIVSEPMSFNYFTQELDFEFLNILRENNFLSWDAKRVGVSCGIHIHISKLGFNGNSHIWKFTNLILENKKQWVEMSGRNSRQWSNYDKNLTPIIPVLHKKASQPRYVAVNLTNEHTIEVRLFRGSLNETRFKSAFELVSGAVEYTRQLSLNALKNDGLKFKNFIQYLNVYRDIYPNAISIAEKKGLI